MNIDEDAYLDNFEKHDDLDVASVILATLALTQEMLEMELTAKEQASVLAIMQATVLDTYSVTCVAKSVIEAVQKGEE